MNKLLFLLVAAAFLLQLLLPVAVSAATFTGRKFTLGSSATSTSTTYTFASNALPTATAVKSVAAQACTTASGACTTPAAFTSGSSTLVAQPTGLGATTGWTVDVAVTGSLRITHATNTTAPSGAVNIQWGSVTNPSAANTTYFLRVTTYSDSAWTTSIDTGVVAVSTATQISVTASIDEALTFCVGQTGITTTSCAGASGTTVALGTLTSSATGSGTSQFAVGTNAETGYAVTINGNTLTCTNCTGSPTITALAAQTASATNTEQFGVNLRDNVTPNVGLEPDGAGSATPTANYNTVDQYRYVTADSIASKATSDQFRRFHVAYIANIRTDTEPGSYSSTFTYIATATF